MRGWARPTSQNQVFRPFAMKPNGAKSWCRAISVMYWRSCSSPSRGLREARLASTTLSTRAGRMVETEIGDAVPRRRVVADNRHLETDLRPVTQLPACGDQLRVDEQGTRLGFGQFHWRSPLGNNGPRRILFGFRSSGFTALGPAPTNCWGMVYSGPPGNARRILIRPAPAGGGSAASKKMADCGLRMENAPPGGFLRVRTHSHREYPILGYGTPEGSPGGDSRGHSHPGARYMREASRCRGTSQAYAR